MSERQPRVPLVRTAEAPASVQQIYAATHAATGGISNLYRALANSPALLPAWVALAWPLRDDLGMARGDREIAIARVAQRLAAPYVWTHHVHFAEAAGAAPEALQCLLSARCPEQFPAGLRAVVQAADELTSEATLSDATWTAILEQFGPAQATELITTLGFYNGVARITRALGVPVETGVPEVPLPSVPPVDAASSPPLT